MIYGKYDEDNIVITTIKPKNKKFKEKEESKEQEKEQEKSPQG